MPPTEETPTEEQQGELAQLTGDEQDEGKAKVEPQIVEKVREPNEDEIRGHAMRMIESNPDQFRSLVKPAETEDDDPPYDPREIHVGAVQEAEERMLLRAQLVDQAVEDAQKHFTGKNVPEHIFSRIRTTLNNPKLSLENLAQHIRAGNHKGIVRDAIGDLAMAGEYTVPTTNAGGEGVGGGASGLSVAQKDELAKAEDMLGRKLTPSEQKEWVLN